MDNDLIKKFVNAYHSTEASIDENKAELAKKKYQTLLKIYNKISNSNLDNTHKELAYEQIIKIHSGIKDISSKSNFTKPILITAILIILVSVLIVAKPNILGLVTFDSNNAPEWIHNTNSFDINGEVQLNLNDYFIDKDNDELNFMITHAQGFLVSLRNSIVTIKPISNFKGTRSTVFMASDEKDVTKVEVVLNSV